MTEEENNENVAANANAAEPTKKKTSVKVVKRVKSKKSEKGERPELAPPPATISEGDSTADTPTPTATPAPTPAPASEPVRRASSKRRVVRSGSNVFAMFSQNQIAQFKEAFGFIDQDKDGIISKADIRASFDALGRLCTEKELDEMVGEASGPINFTMFLTVFGARAQGTDDEDIVLEAFAKFDEGDGFCQEEKLRHVLMTWGEKLSKQECDLILQECPVDSRGRIDIKRFATLVTRGADEENEES